MANPLLTAHSGCLGSRPDTVESLHVAFRSRADFVEIDVRASLDGVVVLSHDPELSGGAKRLVIADTSWDGLKRVFPDLLRAEDAFALARAYGKPLNIDLKEAAVLPFLAAAIRAGDMADRAVLTGCGADLVPSVRLACPEARVFLNARDELPGPDESDYYHFISGTCREAAVTGACGVNIDHRLCRPALVDLCATLALPVMVWTVDDPADFARCDAMGVHGITTNRPDLLSRSP